MRTHSGDVQRETCATPACHPEFISGTFYLFAANVPNFAGERD